MRSATPFPAATLDAAAISCAVTSRDLRRVERQVREAGTAYLVLAALCDEVEQLGARSAVCILLRLRRAEVHQLIAPVDRLFLR